MIEKTVCELFAGVGGFRLGLENSSEDWITVWANQWEPGKKTQHAFDCYCSHFGSSPAMYASRSVARMRGELPTCTAGSSLAATSRRMVRSPRQTRAPASA